MDSDCFKESLIQFRAVLASSVAAAINMLI